MPFMDRLKSKLKNMSKELDIEGDGGHFMPKTSSP